MSATGHVSPVGSRGRRRAGGVVPKSDTTTGLAPRSVLRPGPTCANQVRSCESAIRGDGHVSRVRAERPMARRSPARLRLAVIRPGPGRDAAGARASVDHTSAAPTGPASTVARPGRAPDWRARPTRSEERPPSSVVRHGHDVRPLGPDRVAPPAVRRPLDHRGVRLRGPLLPALHRPRLAGRSCGDTVACRAEPVTVRNALTPARVVRSSGARNVGEQSTHHVMRTSKLFSSPRTLRTILLDRFFRGATATIDVGSIDTIPPHRLTATRVSRGAETFRRGRARAGAATGADALAQGRW